MKPLRECWLAYVRDLPGNLDKGMRAYLEWAFYTGAAAAFTKLRPRDNEDENRMQRQVIRQELATYPVRVQEEELT